MNFFWFWAVDLLKEDIPNAEQQADKLLKTYSGKYNGIDKLCPCVRLAMTDLTFNMGYGTLSKFHNTLTALTNGDWAKADDGLLKSAWCGQVKERCPRVRDLVRPGC